MYVSNVNPGFMATPLIDASVDRAQEMFDAAPASVKQFFHGNVLRANAEGLIKIQEAPSVVGDYIVDHLVTSRYPNFTNYVGWQANALRWFLMLPHLLQEALIRIGTPVKGINHDEVRKVQAASASAAAAAAAAAGVKQSKAPPRGNRASGGDGDDKKREARAAARSRSKSRK